METNIDTEWLKNRNKLDGNYGVQVLPNDNEDIMSRLVKALACVDGLPKDLNYPESSDEPDAVNQYATDLYCLFCEGAEVAEAMMVGDKVAKAYEDAMDESGEAMSDHDKMVDAGFSSGDF